MISGGRRLLLLLSWSLLAAAAALTVSQRLQLSFDLSAFLPTEPCSPSLADRWAPVGSTMRSPMRSASGVDEPISLSGT